MGYVVYMHTTPSDKRYIGITKQQLNHRWRNGNGYTRCTGFWRAIQKYGWENIKHEVIAECETLEEANELERKFIEQYKTHDKRYGYNCTTGGDGVSGWKANDEQRRKNGDAKRKQWQNLEMREKLVAERRARAATESERKRLAEMRDSAWANPEIREKLIEHLREMCGNPEIQKKHGETIRNLWKQDRERFMRNKRVLSGAEHPNAKPVRCIETNEVFPTGKAAADAYGLDQKNISGVVRGRCKTTGGYHWEYAR